jgi:uncharacterized membrane protein
MQEKIITIIRPSTPLRKTPFIIIGIFWIMATIGIALHEPSRVLEQALQVCLSCIGVG